MTRHITYVTGTRADFGLMRSTLELMAEDSRLSVDIVVTGMHLDPAFGRTVDEVLESGLAVAGEVPVDLGAGGAGMANAIGQELMGITDVLGRNRPDVVMVLGDRGEMMAAALAAVHLNMPVVHLHGGERSGTVDESVRHAITKLAHFHFTATAGARDRVVAMGEDPSRVFVTGAPGLDGLDKLVVRDRSQLAADRELDEDRSIALVLYHPVVQQQLDLARQAQAVIEGTLAAGAQVVWFTPNADAGHDQIQNVVDRYSSNPDVRSVVHMARTEFVSWMAAADVMVGNSSSGIIEAAGLGLPVVNVGDRQRLRERSANVTDVPTDQAAVTQAVSDALDAGRGDWENVYGTAGAGRTIADLLATVTLGPDVLEKSNTY
ncbi:MAG: UDP-N-acetylglucosamine 2-epimerase (hydrolyzing) [Acidimicrobiia bacterium]|nr:UDP-N-acetylglucosamine 2-epimerase (hydrolyzing) [Acidimicrobiia bacterium]NNK91960.1 UDP-N-acetylglucosamine 2-epimerase (hydrolyzing) [Acidimicrobiia bacterium]